VTRRYDKYDPFILAQQVVQVYYAPYPLRHDKTDWLVVIKTKARVTIDAVSTSNIDDAYQEDEGDDVHPIDIENDEI